MLRGPLCAVKGFEVRFVAMQAQDDDDGGKKVPCLQNQFGVVTFGREEEQLFQEEFAFLWIRFRGRNVRTGFFLQVVGFQLIDDLTTE